MEENLSVLRDTLYLLACAVNGAKPAEERVSRMETEALLGYAHAHLVDGLVSKALLRARPADAQCLKRLGACMLRAAEREKAWKKAEAGLRAREIWYAPLKGMLLQEVYPEPWMRQMSDYDVLIDPARRADVRDLLCAEGFTVKTYGHAKEDVYANAQGVSFEMHVALFDPAHVIMPVYRYYEDAQRLLTARADGCRAFSPEDFYVYITAHAYLHHDWAGHGLRNFVDAHYLLQRERDRLDWAYIERECRRQGTGEYERLMREIPGKLFSPEALAALETRADWLAALGLTERERAHLFACAASGGAYGSQENRLERAVHALREEGEGGSSLRWRYLARRCFPPREAIVLKYPGLGRVPVLWRAGYLLRLGEALRQGPRFAREWKDFSRLTRR